MVSFGDELAYHRKSVLTTFCSLEDASVVRTSVPSVETAAERVKCVVGIATPTVGTVSSTVRRRPTWTCSVRQRGNAVTAGTATPSVTSVPGDLGPLTVHCVVFTRSTRPPSSLTPDPTHSPATTSPPTIRYNSHPQSKRTTLARTKQFHL